MKYVKKAGVKTSMNRLRLFNNILQARYLSRPNRFLIQCKWKRRTLSAFLPNLGRLQELLLPSRVICLMKEEQFSDRMTHYTAVAVDWEDHPIMLHTQSPNGSIPGKIDSLSLAKALIF
jgi:sugar fermentation stimulation protein A